MHPRGASKNSDDQAMFSKAGPYLSKPEDTNKPKVIPNKYNLRNKNAKGNPNIKIEIPKNMRPWFRDYTGDIIKIKDVYYSKGKYMMSDYLRICVILTTIWINNTSQNQGTYTVSQGLCEARSPHVRNAE